jgi:REP element-mobilizing transposase RayT
LKFPQQWGGRRDGAGRPRLAKRKSVAHRQRPALASRFPVHVSKKMQAGLPRLRGFELAVALKRAFVRGCRREDERVVFRICQFSVQGNHIHLLCEAKDSASLARGIQGWSVRVARGINRHLSRTGQVFEDRYHEEILRSPRQVRHALCYVLQNARRHGSTPPAWAGGVDPFSSAWHFDGWRDQRWRTGLSPPRDLPDLPGPPVTSAKTWLLNVGWRRWGLIGPSEVPAAGREVS